MPCLNFRKSKKKKMYVLGCADFVAYIYILWWVWGDKYLTNICVPSTGNTKMNKLSLLINQLEAAVCFLSYDSWFL